MEDLREPLLVPSSLDTNNDPDDQSDDQEAQGENHLCACDHPDGDDDDVERERGDRGDPTEESVHSWQGPSMLLFVAFLYSTMNISLRILYTLQVPPTPSAVNATRGWLILVFFLPLFVSRRRRRRHRMDTEALVSNTATIEPEEASSHSSSPPASTSLTWAAFEMALYNFFGMAFFNFGLEQTSSPRASFLGQTTVVMVPILSSLTGHALSYWDGLGCLSSLGGLVLLSLEDSANRPTNEDHNTESTRISSFLGVGDLMILAGAVCWSLYMIRMAKFAPVFDVVHLQWTKNVQLAFLYTAWFGASHWRDLAHYYFEQDTTESDDFAHQDGGWQGQWLAWVVLAYSALGPGTLADLLQQKAQESVGPTESNLILCTESVFTVLLGRLLLGEETSWMEKVGGAFLILGAAVSGQ